MKDGEPKPSGEVLSADQIRAFIDKVREVTQLRSPRSGSSVSYVMHFETADGYISVNTPLSPGQIFRSDGSRGFDDAYRVVVREEETPEDGITLVRARTYAVHELYGDPVYLESVRLYDNDTFMEVLPGKEASIEEDMARVDDSRLMGALDFTPTRFEEVMRILDSLQPDVPSDPNK